MEDRGQSAQEPFAGGYFDGPPAEYVHFRAGICPGGRYGSTLRRFQFASDRRGSGRPEGARTCRAVSLHNYRRGRRGPSSDAGAAPVSAPTGLDMCQRSWHSAVAHGRDPSGHAGLDYGGRGGAQGGRQSVGLLPQAVATGGSRGLLRILFAVSGRSGGRPGLAGGPLFCLEYEPAHTAKPRRAGRGTSFPTAPGGHDLAVFQRLPPSAGPLSAAGQLPGAAGSGAGPADLADQHRHGALELYGRRRSGVGPPKTGARSDGTDAVLRGAAGEVEGRPPVQLVRHRHGKTAGAAVCVLGGLGQSVRLPDRSAGGAVGMGRRGTGPAGGRPGGGYGFFSSV